MKQNSKKFITIGVLLFLLAIFLVIPVRVTQATGSGPDCTEVWWNDWDSWAIEEGDYMDYDTSSVRVHAIGHAEESPDTDKWYTNDVNVYKFDYEYIEIKYKTEWTANNHPQYHRLFLMEEDCDGVTFPARACYNLPDTDGEWDVFRFNKDDHVISFGSPSGTVESFLMYIRYPSSSSGDTYIEYIHLLTLEAEYDVIDECIYSGASLDNISFHAGMGDWEHFIETGNNVLYLFASPDQQELPYVQDARFKFAVRDWEGQGELVIIGVGGYFEMRYRILDASTYGDPDMYVTLFSITPGQNHKVDLITDGEWHYLTIYLDEQSDIGDVATIQIGGGAFRYDNNFWFMNIDHIYLVGSE